MDMGITSNLEGMMDVRCRVEHSDAPTYDNSSSSGETNGQQDEQYSNDSEGTETYETEKMTGHF